MEVKYDLEGLNNYVKEKLHFSEYKNTITPNRLSDEDVKTLNDNICLSIKHSYLGVDGMNIYYYNKQVIKVGSYSYEFHTECERTKLASELELGAPFIKYEIHTKNGDRYIFLYTEYVNECKVEDLYNIIEEYTNNNKVTTYYDYLNNITVNPNYQKILVNLSDEVNELINNIYSSELITHLDFAPRNIRRLNGKLIAIDWYPRYSIDDYTLNLIRSNIIEENILKIIMEIRLCKYINIEVNNKN